MLQPAKPVPVVIPQDFWDSEAEEDAVLAKWLVEDGARVQPGERIAEIMVDKVTMDVDAPAAGRIAIVVPEEAPLALGDVIAKIYP